MDNARAIAASSVMVMVAALGCGALLAWQQSAPAPAATAPAEVIVEYVDAPAVESIGPVANNGGLTPAMSPPESPMEAALESGGAYEEHDEEDDGEEEHGEEEQGDDEHGHDEQGHDEQGHDEQAHDEHGHDEHGDDHD